MAFKIKVTEQEFNEAFVGGEWWQRVPDEDDSSVFIVTAVHKKHQDTSGFYLITGAFYKGPEFIHGDSGIRDYTLMERINNA